MPTVNRKIQYYPHPSVLRVKLDFRKTWSHSPRNAKGELVLKSLGYSLFDYKDVAFTYTSRDSAVLLHGSTWNFSSAPLTGIYAGLEASSYAKLRGKLYKGSAALGVTLGSYKQSREMIVKRYQQMTNQWEHLSKVLSSRNRKRGDQLTGAHLELIFGWKPLLSDIYAAAMTVVQEANVSPFIRASSSQSFVVAASAMSGSHTAIGRATVTRAAQVRITNPNLWLLERYGVLNPAAIAWDLVPYSFIVNMFVNTGQLVNSITDFAGLSFDNGTLTKKAHWLQDCKTSRYGKGYKLESYKMQNRTVGKATVRPPLVFKIPEANWELAAMAGSLFAQRTSGLFSRLLRHSRASAL